ncbi:ATP-dependent zinc metalloprotease FtsH [Aestuariicella hydrocarbonica]|uniref:ATP-dependent zinc metalloprotease FtsH n=1 Tax=Pseudomaricurvus hydrocarbonicus TaxID=1470433 RepID=A0A9E5JPX5_9GAMM|nr:ATP-dependent zinc metalloprotease FtsH [Aestuariicella hydrocarbonica]NHO64443.1 ATP-dependent zinc metalloprotease FtsH [Aestuariicella hydrocarbonica]
MSTPPPDKPSDKGGPPRKPPEALHRDPWFVWLMMAVFFSYFWLAQGQDQQSPLLPYSEFIQSLESGEIGRVEIRGLDLSGGYNNSDKSVDFRTRLPEFIGDEFLQKLESADVDVNVKSSETPVWVNLLVGFLPWVFIIGVFVLLSRSVQSRMGGMGGLGGGLSFSNSKARRFEKKEGGITYDDVAGLEGAKQDLGDIIEFLKNPEKYQALGAKIPKGILMMGAPGTGKTLLARATAAEAGVPFFSITGSEFIELYVGVGASRVRDMFLTARKEAPALIFIDEIDSVGRIRGTGMGGGNDEREQTLNQILAEMDGFDPEDVVVVLAATNRPDVLDPALLRPGRFDRKVVLDLPDKAARVAIFQVHTRKTPLASDVDLKKLAGMTVGFSGADIENLVNEASLRAAREDRHDVTSDDFLVAREKVLMGDERPNLLTSAERERVACHEAGHGLITFYSEHSDPLQKISIVPRGRALGVTEQLASEERHNFDEDFLRDRLRIFMGGRCAEQLLYHNCSSGAADDLKQATKLARQMVVNWGMSKDVGPMGFAEGERHPFLGRELTEPRPYSEALAEKIDEEVKQLLLRAEAEAMELLDKHRQGLDKLMAELLEHESLGSEEVVACLS